MSNEHGNVQLVPEPIFLQLRQLGNIVTSTKQHLYSEFPALPYHVVQGNGGYYGPLVAPGSNTDDNIHNFYEEIPSLGVTSEADRASISNQQAGL